VEVRPTVVVEGYELAVEDERAPRQRRDVLGDPGEPRGDVTAGSRVEPDAVEAFVGLQAPAVPFDLVRPLLARRRLSAPCRRAGDNETAWAER
jgi:hypothetical protein